MLSMVGLAAIGLYPRLVPSSTDLAYSLTIPLPRQIPVKTAVERLPDAVRWVRDKVQGSVGG